MEMHPQGVPHIVLFGAGKSATGLIDFLVRQPVALTVVDASLQAALSKTHGFSAHAVGLDVLSQAEERLALVRSAAVVISLMPPLLHQLIASDCLSEGRHLLTASYVDDAMRSMAPLVRDRGILFLCEMGLDPGIDHMSAMSMLDRLRGASAEILAFRSHCGGLVAPSSDDNPWRYKISWNPRNVVLAGKAGARYREDGAEVALGYADLFDPSRLVTVPGLGPLAWYPNRDSLGYAPLYGLAAIPTFIRTTLRHPEFCAGWRSVIQLGLTDETLSYQTDGLSLAEFYRGFGAAPDERLRFLGWSSSSLINRGLCSAADVLQYALESYLPLAPSDRDMVVMMHEITYRLDGQVQTDTATLILEGQDAVHTAMARTVGLPLGIAAMLILEGSLRLTGLHIPTLPEIYEPVLGRLAREGVRFI
ncbi:MAG TPA: saccharopine dehydrogenase C-terminal domain-containing protein [Dinghuibacter sp.]|uniref:saccharopine dehydrogenase C-terminal domain-containing protein n=1 Tax=Dinghuibacter sp. TaxID=2024697 RepID=UPI002B9A6D21|nr:saccharopine dehydrogenase C-terminal domain-containing protein [Dinghuibacter sp.]HTJ12017.1 saccharopine dehydrogenase C-terminal domain-containing protein [Dinghuibacter sp.]